MLKVGEYNNFLVVKKTSRGYHIESDGESLFIPKRELPPQTVEGHRVKLFVYNKGRDDVRATSQVPYASVGQFAYLKIKEVTQFGLFLDWGLDKDLFVPKRFVPERLGKPKAGTSHVVRLLLDDDGRHVIGSLLIDDYLLDKPGKELKPKQQARILICGIKDIGFKVIVNDKYRGMLYRDERADEIRYGEKRQAYIRKIRPDGRVDVSLDRPQVRLPGR